MPFADRQARAAYVRSYYLNNPDKVRAWRLAAQERKRAKAPLKKRKTPEEVKARRLELQRKRRALASAAQQAVRAERAAQKKVERDRRRAAAAIERRKKERARVFTEAERMHRRAYQKTYNASEYGRAKIAARCADPVRRLKKSKSRKRYRDSERGRAYEQARAIAKAHRRRIAAGDPIPTKTVRALLQTTVCYYCGVGLCRTRLRYHPCKVTMDHKVPISRGGTNDVGNLVAACLDCNIYKGSSTAEEFFARRLGMVASASLR